jgi:microcystin-dependent protein
MAISFPENLDTLVNPSSTDTLDSPSHSDQHSDLNDAVEALEVKVGADSSAVTSSHDYKIATLEAAQPTGDIVGTTDTQTLTNKTIDADDNTFSGMLDWFYPVGTIYETTSTDLDTTTKMGNHFGGTWSAIGEGRVLVGKASSGTFNTAGATGGAETHTLTTAQLPAHNHTQSSHNHKTSGGSYTNFTLNRATDGTVGSTSGGAYFPAGSRTSSTASSTPAIQNTGSGDAHNNLQPYLVVYMFERTA